MRSRVIFGPWILQRFSCHSLSLSHTYTILGIIGNYCGKIVCFVRLREIISSRKWDIVDMLKYFRIDTYLILNISYFFLAGCPAVISAQPRFSYSLNIFNFHIFVSFGFCFSLLTVFQVDVAISCYSVFADCHRYWKMFCNWIRANRFMPVVQNTDRRIYDSCLYMAITDKQRKKSQSYIEDEKTDWFCM